MDNILLIVTGASPQVLTETLFALHQQGKALPNQIYVITTLQSKASLIEGLFEQGHLQALINDYQLPPVTFSESDIWVIEDEQGNPVLDAKSERDQVDMADFITRKVFELTSNPNTSIHASIAGGRKTMAFYLGYAMSLLGREQDSLSHVFIEDEFEFLPEFYYPTPYSKRIENKHLNRVVDCQQATVTLAEIPFVRMRKSVDQKLINTMQNASFSQTVATLNLAHDKRLELTVSPRAKTLEIAGITISLSVKEFAFYCWLHEYTKQGGLLVDRNFEDEKEHSRTFLNYFVEVGRDPRVFQQFDVTPEDFIEGKLEDLKPMNRDFIQQTRSKINKKIHDVLPMELARRVAIESTKDGHNMVYKLNTGESDVSVVFRN